MIFPNRRFGSCSGPRRDRRRGACHGAGADAVGDLHRAFAPEQFSRLRCGQHPCEIDGDEDHRHGRRQLDPADEADRGEVDDGRQQRQVEHHDLGVAERHRHAGEEQFRRRIFAWHLALARLDRGRPHLPGEVGEIGDADPLHRRRKRSGTSAPPPPGRTPPATARCPRRSTWRAGTGTRRESLLR